MAASFSRARVLVAGDIQSIWSRSRPMAASMSWTISGNFLVPLMIGARDLAFPWRNLLSWYIFMIGGSIALWILIFGGVDTGWTFYTPFSTMFSNTMVVPAATAVFITGFSSILTGLNFIVTI